MTAESQFPRVFDPVDIGPVRVPNRLYWVPHGLLAVGTPLPDPTAPGFLLPSPNVAPYYAARARGGLGLIIQGGTIVHPASRYPGGSLQLFSDAAVHAWKPVVDAVHEHGTKIFVQLFHAGHHGDHEGLFGGPLSSSPLPPVEGFSLGPRYDGLPVPVIEMTHDDIREAVESFELCARNARLAGYDGVELHASHSYLAEQFYSPFYNKRSDEYGGSLENRMRFLNEVLAALRRGIGPDRAVGLRLICDEMLPGGLGVAEMREVAQRIDRSGLVDFFDLDIGTYHDMDVMIASYQLGEHWEMESIRALRPAISQAVVLGCPGRFSDPAKAEALISGGTLDMVGGARGLFAEPELARKAREGRVSEIRHCIGVNLCNSGVAKRCALNASHTVEITHGDDLISPAATSRRVVVVGGGPAGMEAARIAALRGHEVALFESRAELGGNLRRMRIVPGREHFPAAADWWSDELLKLGVELRLGTAATLDAIRSEAPDVVLFAMGARFDRAGATGYRTGPIAGFGRPFVYTADDVLDGDVTLHGRVIVIEEEDQGAFIAAALAARGATVEVITRHPLVGNGLAVTSQQMHQLRQLARLGVAMTPHTWVSEIGEHSLIVFDVITGTVATIGDVAAVVLVTGRTPVTDLVARAAGDISEYHVIGDARHPRGLSEATREGHDVAWSL